MKPALLLIDLQNDYLAAAGLQPSAGEVIDNCRALLAGFRAAGLPVLHIFTTVTRDPDNRMPHWKAANRWLCEQGTPGHGTPPGLEPLPAEAVIHKQFFSGFENPALEKILRDNACERLILAGIHLHGCVRSTALDAYARRFSVSIANDAVTSDDPVHAAITRRYLAARAIPFEPISSILSELRTDARASAGPRVYRHICPYDRQRLLWEVPIETANAVKTHAAALAGRTRENDAESLKARASMLRQVAAALQENSDPLALEIMTDVGKPITMARAEVQRAAALLHAVADRADEVLEEKTSAMTRCRRRPLGVIGLLTPWNNPLAIPVGKLAPAILYGNAVLWKPALPGSRIAQSLLTLWRRGDPAVPITLITGDAQTAIALAGDPHVDAMTLSGSELAGYAIGEIAARRTIPFQAELGGNNAAIVAEGADLAAAARQIAAGAFGFAGQRCTANRRAIVFKSLSAQFQQALIADTRQLPFGPPEDPTTAIGPVISDHKRRQLLALFSRARDQGASLVLPHGGDVPGTAPDYLAAVGSYCAPVIALAGDPQSEIVQHESFGPLLVLQEADSFDHALELCNGVRQGLVAALFGGTGDQVSRFLAQARAGILKLNQSTMEADAVSPFGGWKASGIGPPEHGIADRDFFTRLQTLYDTRP